MRLKFIIAALLIFTTLLLKGEKLDTLGVPIINEFTQTICRGTTFEGYAFFGTYRDTFITETCDSIRILHLRFYTPTFDTKENICIDETDPNAPEIGTYIETRIDSNGCEFEHTINVAVQPPDLITHVSLCNGQTFTTSAGVLIDTSGIYIFEELIENGCTYYELLDVTFIPTGSTITSSIAICPGDSILWNGSYYSIPDNYLINTGCEGTAILNLTFLPQEDCSPLSTSDTHTTDLSLYPNPAHDFLIIEGLGSRREAQRVQIVDQRGAIVYSDYIDASQSSLDIAHLSSGVYLLQVTDALQKSQVIKFVKN